MRTRRAILMMCISAALAGAATLAVTRRNPAKRATPSAEEKFVPEQVLQFRDARRLPLAEFEIGTNHVNILRLYGAHGYAATVLLYDDSGGWSLLLDGKEVNDETVEKPKTKDLLKSLEELATRQTEDNYARPTRGTLSVRTLGDRSNIMIDVRMPSGKSEIFYTKAFPRKGMSEEWKLNVLMPTQDVRIVRRNGMPVAVLGLSEWGAPIVALTDKTGRILTTWQLTQREWSDLGFFDASGQLRISLELHPEKVPNLMIFEPDERLLTARYVIDPETGKEIPGESGALPWLTPVDLQPTIPISLVDQRGKVMWTAP